MLTTKVTKGTRKSETTKDTAFPVSISVSAFESVWRDLQHGLRRLRQDRGFAVAALMSLSLGIGATTAIFQLLDALRLRALPVADPQQLAEIRAPEIASARSGTVVGRRPMLTNALWERIRDGQQGFSSVAAWSASNLELSSGGESHTARGLWVSGGFFTTLDVQALIGRVFTDSDDRRGCSSPGVVLSHSFWLSRYGAKPQALGELLTLNGHAMPIIGVTPARFTGVEVGHGFDVALPLCAEPLIAPEQHALDRPNFWWLAAIGRLRSDWTLTQTSAQLAAISPVMFADAPPTYVPERAQRYRSLVLSAFAASSGVSDFRQRYESPLWMLLSIAGLVLFIACANLANLMLARMRARAKEISVRLAIGASPFRVARQLLVESLLVAGIGGVLGVWLSQALSRLLVSALATSTETPDIDLRVNWQVLTFAAGVAVATCTVFGLAPALRAMRQSPADAMKAGRGTTDTGERFAISRLVVVGQVAVSLVLVTGAVLFGRSLRNLYELDTGFDPEHVLVMSLDVRRARVPVERADALEQDLLGRLRAMPGVSSAASVFIEPVGGYSWGERIVIDGAVRKEGVNFNRVSPDFFATMSTPLLAGRDFDGHDGPPASRVAIVNESFVRTFLGDESPLDRVFQIEAPPGTSDGAIRIVGVVKDTKYADLRAAFAPAVYLPFGQGQRGGQFATFFGVVLRSSLPAAMLAPSLTEQVAAVEPSMLLRFKTLNTQIADGLVRERLMASLSGFFGLIAVILAAIGVYGVMSYASSLRRNEIGIRLALGATRSSVIRLMLRDAWLAIGAGIAVGLALVALLGRGVASLLFGLQTTDPSTLASATVALAAIAYLASYVPARRASRLDPMIALRQ